MFLIKTRIHSPNDQKFSINVKLDHAKIMYHIFKHSSGKPDWDTFLVWFRFYLFSNVSMLLTQHMKIKYHGDRKKMQSTIKLSSKCSMRLIKLLCGAMASAMASAIVFMN